MIENIRDMIAKSEATIDTLEARLSGAIIPTQTDMQLHDRISYHYGVVGGLRQAIFVLIAHEETI